MKNKKIILVTTLILILFLSIVLYRSFGNFRLTSNRNIEKEGSGPFLIEANLPIIEKSKSKVFEGDKLVEQDGEDSRLSIKVSIINKTDLDFNDVWYELELNPEVEPFIASKILKFTSDTFYVTTEKQALLNSQDEILMISGFEHDWDMLLTSEDKLLTYYNKEPDDIYNDLKSITVKVIWNDGNQEEVIPISLIK